MEYSGTVNPMTFILTHREGSSFHDWFVQCEGQYDTREVKKLGHIGPLTYSGNCYPAQKITVFSKKHLSEVFNETIKLKIAHFWRDLYVKKSQLFVEL